MPDENGEPTKEEKAAAKKAARDTIKRSQLPLAKKMARGVRKDERKEAKEARKKK